MKQQQKFIKKNPQENNPANIKHEQRKQRKSKAQKTFKTRKKILVEIQI